MIPFGEDNLKKAGLALLVILALFGVGRGIVGAVSPLNPKYWDGSNDFQWSPSRVLLNGTDPYALYKEMGPANNAKPDAPFILSQWADYPPSSLMILWPLAAMSWPCAKWCWLGLNLLSIGVIVWSARRVFDIPKSTFIWFVLLFLACPSTSSTLKSGQHGLFSVAMFLVAVVFGKEQNVKGNELWSGLFLALAWLKYSITLPLSLFFLVRRQRRVSMGVALALHGLATMFAAFWTGTTPIELLRGNLEVAAGNLGMVVFDLSQTVEHIGLPGYVLLVGGLSCIVLYAVSRAGEESQGETLCMLSFFSFILLPHLRYDLFLLVIPLAFALSLKPKDVTVARLILFSVLQLWFIREGIESTIGQRPTDLWLVKISELMIAVSISFLYLPIIVSWLRLSGWKPIGSLESVVRVLLPRASSADVG